MTRIFAAFLLIAAIGVPAEAQRAPTRVTRNGPKIRHAFRPALREARRSTVRVICNGKAVALGTVVDKNGHVLTKASELTQPMRVRLFDGSERPARALSYSDAHDLALIKIDTDRPLTPATWAKQTPKLGHWLATTDPLDPDPVAIGVVSVSPRKLKAKGFLGIGFGDAEDGVRIGQVLPGSAAQRAGLKAGDTIAAVDGQDVSKADAVIKAISKHLPGENVKIEILRDKMKQVMDIELGRRPTFTSPRQSRMELSGGALSDRRHDFERVLQHDTALRPEQCGGPLVNLDGRIVGVNVARAGRVASYAIPADEARRVTQALLDRKDRPDQDLIRAMKARGLDHRLESARQAVKAAEQKQNQASKQVEKAKQALQDLEKEKSRLEREAAEAPSN